VGYRQIGCGGWVGASRVAGGASCRSLAGTTTVQVVPTNQTCLDGLAFWVNDRVAATRCGTITGIGLVGRRRADAE
jgi:hypothetical protein